MGSMNFGNNGKKKWTLVFESAVSKKNSGCISRSTWHFYSDLIDNKESTNSVKYSRSGALGSVEFEIKCVAKSSNWEITDPDSLKIWQSNDPAAPTKFWDITSCQLFVVDSSFSVSGPYGINAEVTKVTPYNAGKGKANWAGVKLDYKVVWSGGLGSPETATGSVNVFMTAAKLGIVMSGI